MIAGIKLDENKLTQMNNEIQNRMVLTDSKKRLKQYLFLRVNVLKIISYLGSVNLSLF